MTERERNILLVLWRRSPLKTGQLIACLDHNQTGPAAGLYYDLRSRSTPTSLGGILSSLSRKGLVQKRGIQEDWVLTEAGLGCAEDLYRHALDPFDIQVAETTIRTLRS